MHHGKSLLFPLSSFLLALRRSVLNGNHVYVIASLLWGGRGRSKETIFVSNDAFVGVGGRIFTANEDQDPGFSDVLARVSDANVPLRC